MVRLKGWPSTRREVNQNVPVNGSILFIDPSLNSISPTSPADGSFEDLQRVGSSGLLLHHHLGAAVGLASVPEPHPALQVDLLLVVRVGGGPPVAVRGGPGPRLAGADG